MRKLLLIMFFIVVSVSAYADTDIYKLNRQRGHSKVFVQVSKNAEIIVVPAGTHNLRSCYHDGPRTGFISHSMRGWAVLREKVEINGFIYRKWWVEKWEMCGNEAGCWYYQRIGRVQVQVTPKATPPRREEGYIGCVVGESARSHIENPGRMPVRPSETVNLGSNGAQIGFGWRKIKPKQNVVPPKCEPLPGKPGGLPDDPTPGQTR